MTRSTHRPAAALAATAPPNQPDRRPQTNEWAVDAALQHWTRRAFERGGARVEDFPKLAERLDAIGEMAGRHHIQDLAERANRNDPQLAAFDRAGNRVDEVAFDPAWHELLDSVTSTGVCGLPWSESVPGGHVARAAAFSMWARIDMGVMCPVSMTTAAVPVLLADGSHAAREWVSQLTHPAGGTQPLAGMSMTEPQGGSDVGTTETTAVDAGDGSFRISGHKWFVSHPVADVLLVLAREPDLGAGSRGLSCFLVPGWHDGKRNGIRLMRLKDKLGTRSLASAEVIFDEAVGVRLGEPGRGVATIIEMVACTRLDCMLGGVGIMARVADEIASYTRQREAFGAALSDQPLMQMVVADMLVEREAATALALEAAALMQASDPLARLVIAAGKYWITRRSVAVAIEACECMGGNGYVEEWPLARLYRDAQVNSTWEGSGNVVCLDVLRAAARHDEFGDLLERWIAVTGGASSPGAGLVRRGWELARSGRQETARAAARDLAVGMQAVLLAGQPAERIATVERAFVATRVEEAGERPFGTVGPEGAEALAAVASAVGD